MSGKYQMTLKNGVYYHSHKFDDGTEITFNF